MRQRKRSRLALYLGLAAVLVFFLFPVAWLALGALKSNVELRNLPPVLLPSDPLAALNRNIDYVLIASPVPLGKVISNTLIVAVTSALVALALGVTAAYSFARFRTGGPNLPFLILTLRMSPAIAVGLPFFILFRQLGLVDTQLGLIIANTTFNLPFVIWLMRSFFREMDQDIESAALVDGASRWQVLRYVALPLAGPAIVATGLLSFIASWNEFFFAILLTRTNATTLPVLLPHFLARSIGPGEPLGGSFVLAMLGTIPVVVLAFLLQGSLLRGLSLGTVKE
jgi:multiple sugar transport system permease protein